MLDAFNYLYYVQNYADIISGPLNMARYVTTNRLTSWQRMLQLQ